MIDWHESMEQTFEYYVVDPGTWKDKQKLDTVKPGSTIKRDSKSDTLGSASIKITGLVGECYIRAYLIAIQNGVTYKEPLGTFLVQTPSSSFDGKVKSVTLDAYTPLIELNENPPALGYFTPKKSNTMDEVYRLARDNCRAPVVPSKSDKVLYSDFVANTSDTWLTYCKDLAANADYELGLDEMGRIIFPPTQELESLQPVTTYNDDNSSILLPSITMEHDIYGIPNIVEIVYSNNNDYYYSRVVNDDVNSPTSTVNRGREIIHRVTDLNLAGIPTKAQVDEYAEKLLKSLSTVEYTITYTHGYCQTRLGDCVRLNYKAAGLIDVKAKVISQSITCESGCPVEETAKYTKNLWR